MSNCKLIAIEHISLDGVYQAPARTDEDRRDGFSHGGWSNDTEAHEVTQEAVAKHMKKGWRLLAGQTTYEDLYEGWLVRQPEHPMTKALTNVQKFVASRDAHYKPIWDNSTLLEGDANEAIAKLKKEDGMPFIIFGSGVLVRSLMEQGLIDEFVLMIHPVVLGEGRKFFDGAPFSKFKLVEEVTGNTGVIVATYQYIVE